MFFLLSMLGLLSVERLTSRCKKTFDPFDRFSTFSFWLLVFPIYLFLHFKDHFYLFSIYIGLILATLIFFFIFFEKKLKKVFLMSQLSVLNGISLHIQAGKSSQKVLLDVFQSLSSLEKIVYQPLQLILNKDYSNDYNQFAWTNSFFNELRMILKSENRLFQQIDMMKSAIKVKNRLVLRKQQVTRQIKAQAFVAVFVYFILFTLSYSQLNLKESPLVILTSISFLCLSILLILKIGEKIKWSL